MKIFHHIITITLLTCILSACSSEPELDKKTRILNKLQSMETAIEAKGLDDFFEHVSDDFKSTDRGWNKKDAERLLRIRLMRNKSVHVHQNVKRIDWLDDGDQQAEVEVVAAMAGTDFSLTDMPSFRGDMVKFLVTFQLIDGEYLITQTEWNRATPGDFVF
jgi:hypothetical protein